MVSLTLRLRVSGAFQGSSSRSILARIGLVILRAGLDQLLAGAGGHEAVGGLAVEEVRDLVRRGSR